MEKKLGSKITIFSTSSGSFFSPTLTSGPWLFSCFLLPGWCIDKCESGCFKIFACGLAVGVTPSFALSMFPSSSPTSMAKTIGDLVFSVEVQLCGKAPIWEHLFKVSFCHLSKNNTSIWNQMFFHPCSSFSVHRKWILTFLTIILRLAVLQPIFIALLLTFGTALMQRRRPTFFSYLTVDLWYLCFLR